MTSRFQGQRWHSPTLTVDDAAAIARTWWEVEGTWSALDSNQDQNFRLRAADGRRFVLKVANERTPRADVDVQNAAMAHLAARSPGFEHPVAVPTVDGDLVAATAGHAIRLVTWVDGVPMDADTELDDAGLQAFGRLAGRCVTALSGADLLAARRATQWDPALATEVVAGLRADIDDIALLAAADTALARSSASLERCADLLPRQVIHGDLTDFNTLGRPGPTRRLELTGVIDFGDVVHTWRVAELAITANGLVGRSLADPLRAVVEVTRGFAEVVALTDAEVDGLWGVVLARAALLAVSDAQQVAVEPHNAYARRALDLDGRILHAVVGVPPELARTAIRLATGRPPDPRWTAAAERLGRLALDPTVVGRPFRPAGVSGYDVVDLTAESDDLGAGDWADLDALTGLLHRPGRVVVARHDEARITFARPDHAGEPRSVHLGHDLFVTAGTEVLAPVSGRVEEIAEGSLWLRPSHPELDEVVVRLLNVEPAVEVGATVTLGDVIGTVAAQARATGVPAHLHVQAGLGVERPQGGVTARHRAAWAVHVPPLLPDPSWRAPIRPPADHARERRLRHVARAQKLYYPERPVEIVRGWRHHLYDTDGRAYLDVVNNVAVLGHSHPAVTEAARRQLDRLNTNSRFLYPALTELAERLSATCPPSLSHVFLVNSGSEASDLALRLARHTTGHRGVVAIEGGYHGWTTAVTEYTSNRHDNPLFERLRPPHVEVVPSPDLYRGAHRDHADPGTAHAAEVAAACARLEPHGGVAAFVFEGLLGNQGGLDLPTGYLARALAAVRAAGGLAVADEVQVGYGRTGSAWWAFENHGVVPDIVTVAKAMGNGHPVGAVITTPAIAESFAADYPFFSSVGGSPVSCAIALAVLDTVEAEGLQANAAAVGAELAAGLRELIGRHLVVGAVHGTGLYLGVDLVLDRTTREPAVEVAEAVCLRMRDRGVIVQTTGDLGNILKVKPPLCITAASARFFVDQLDATLSELA